MANIQNITTTYNPFNLHSNPSIISKEKLKTNSKDVIDLMVKSNLKDMLKKINDDVPDYRISCTDYVVNLLFSHDPYTYNIDISTYEYYVVDVGQKTRILKPIISSNKMSVLINNDWTALSINLTYIEK
jgi:hypothetical protein